MKQFLNQAKFNGGIADDEKTGYKNSYLWGRSIEVRKDPDKFYLLPKTTKESLTTVTDRIKWMVTAQPHATDIYALSHTGILWKRTSAGVWSSVRSVGGGGQGLEIYNDYIYYTQDTQIGRYGTLSGGSPSATDNWQTSLNDTSAYDFAPIKRFIHGLAVGQGNDLGWWDGTTWDQDKLVLPPGFQIRCMDRWSSYLAIAAWRGTNIYDAEDSVIFFWDGTSSTYNHVEYIEAGAVNAMVNHDGRLRFIAGHKGELFDYNGYVSPLRRLPRLTAQKYVEVFPGAMTVWDDMVRIGFSANTDDSTTHEQGVYTYGRDNKDDAEVYTYDYPISTGTRTATTLKITSVAGIGRDLFIAWDDNGTYGVDNVDEDNAPYSTGVLETLIFDNGKRWKDKETMRTKVDFEALNTGESVVAKYDVNRSGSWSTGVTASTAADTELREDYNKQFKELEIQVNLATSTTTSPKVDNIGFIFDDREEAKQE
jgi:hypothetical protein